jgi:16S rRNA (cytosine967-C5)-methyltransferase
VKPVPGARSRAAAARVLDAVLHQGCSLKAELHAALPGFDDPRDRALVEAMSMAALRQSARYDAALAAWLPRPLARRDRELRALLLVGFAQLDPLGLPPHAAVAATVDAARMLGRQHQTGLVNALLRRAQRDGLPPAMPHAQWPQWLRERIAGDWPGEHGAILAASGQPPPLWLRVNRRRGTRETYAGRLRDAGLEPEIVDDLPDALRLASAVPVADLPGFAEGLVSVQDGAAQAVADALALPAGARVLDACAAPGGKAAHLLERAPSLRLTALDIDAARLRQVAGTLERLQLGGADLHAADGCDLDAWWDGTPFDAILLDAPCSATGIIRRQPDILLHRRASDLEQLVRTQAGLLDSLWRTLAPGGVLLYATCSVLAAENAGQVDAFLARTGDARAEPLDARYGRPSGAGRQRLPGDSGMDGFFYARLRKA